MHTVTADLLIHYIWVPEVSLIEGQNSLWLCARGLQMGLIWLDKDNQQMLFFRMDAVDADGPRRGHPPRRMCSSTDTVDSGSTFLWSIALS